MPGLIQMPESVASHCNVDPAEEFPPNKTEPDVLKSYTEFYRRSSQTALVMRLR